MTPDHVAVDLSVALHDIRARAAARHLVQSLLQQTVSVVRESRAFVEGISLLG
jgi:hypothetical protein